MRALWLLPLVLLAGCSDAKPDKTRLVIQRFFGACEAEYGRVTDIARAEGECGIMTAMINRFEAENPDVDVVENVVFWPGYDQLTAQLAANDAPDLVTMHGSVIPDYRARDLLEPLDKDLAAIGAPPAMFTNAARAAVTVDGRTWGLPIDTWAPLWHINLNLFRKAGLVRDGKPILPRSPEELFAQAQQFRTRTGKPYLVQGAANEYAGFTRNFYTFVMQQNGALFRDGRANFQTEEARNALQLFKAIYDRDFTTKNQDYSAAVAGFLNGDGGVFLVGTWMVGTFDAKSHETSGALANGGYTVVPYPKLFQREATFADGHNWVMPRDSRRSPTERAAAVRFLKFFAGHARHWARTGHLPAFQAIIQSEEWRALPHRDNLAILATTAQPLPKEVRRQFPIETIVGTEAAAAIAGAKPIDRTLADMERRVNAVLDNL